MNVRHASASLLLAPLLWSWPVHGCCAARADGPAAATRLELAGGSHDGVVPLAIAADRSRWRPAGSTDPAAVVEVPTPDVVRWGTVPPWPSGSLVLLRDGGVLAGRIESADEKTVVVVSAALGRLVLPADAVRGFRAGLGIGPGGLGTAAEPAERTHVLVLANGDRARARRIDWQGGTLAADVPGGRAVDTTTIPIPADVVRAVDFVAPTAPPPAAAGLRILAALMDGSRFEIQSLEPAPPLTAAPRSRLVLRLSAAVTATCDTDEILAVAVDGGRATFLAAREPSACETSAQFGPPTRGRTFTGDWPAVRGTTAFTSLGVHAPARIRYRLDAPATRFEALVAVDDTVGTGGSVIVRVLAAADGSSLQEVFSSKVLRGAEAPEMIRVALPSATQLELAIDPADGGAVLDRTLWLDPVVVRDSAADAATTR